MVAPFPPQPPGALSPVGPGGPLGAGPGGMLGGPPPPPNGMGGPMAPPAAAPPPPPPGAMPPATLDAPPPEPDPLDLIFARLSAMDPMQLRDFLASLRKKERDALLAIAAEAHPDLSDKLRAAMPLPATYEPERPKWYAKPSKPDVPTLLRMARRDWDAYNELRTRFKDDFNAYMNRTWGRFQIDQGKDQQTDDGAVFVATALSSEINMRSAILAEHEIAYDVPQLSPDLLDETQKEENFLHYLDDLAERRHANRSNGSFRYDVAWNFQIYGRAIVRRVIDLQDPEDPFDEVLIDPSTCCPIWGGKHGLLRVTRRYSEEIGVVARDYGVDPKTITSPVGGAPDGKPFRELSIEHTVNVVEWWDESWYGVYTDDGRPIKALADHRYGEVPFVVQLVSRGLPSNFADPATKQSTDPMDPMGSQRKNDLKLKGLSAIYWLKFTHRQREAFVGKIMDALLKSDAPPIWLGMDTFSKTQPVPKMGTKRGRVYPFDRDHHVPQVPQYAPIPPIVEPLMESVSTDWGMEALPLAAYGVNPQANTSGAALDGLAEGKNSKLTVDALAMQAFFQRRAEQTLRWWRDWGRLVEDAEGRYGVFTVPAKRRTPTGPASFALTPDVIERTGTRVNVRLTRTPQAALGAFGAALLQLVNSPTQLLSARNAMERLGLPDPDAEQQQIDYERARGDQRAQDLRMLSALLAQTGEPIDPQELAKLFAQIFAQGVISSMTSGGGQGGGGGPPGSARPPVAGPMGGPPPPGVSAGVNMGTYGSPPGANGGMVGRPMGGSPENAGP